MGLIKRIQNKEQFQIIIETARLTLQERAVRCIPAVWGGLMTLMGLFVKDQKVIISILILMVILAITTTCICAKPLYESVKKGHIQLPFLLEDHSVMIMQNDFEKNLDYLLNTLSDDEMKSLIAVMGIDSGGCIYDVLGSGVAYSVREYLDRNYICLNNEKPSEHMQKCIDQYITANVIKKLSQKEQNDYFTNKKRPVLDYGTCILAEMKMKRIAGEDNKEYCYTNMMVVNSTSERQPSGVLKLLELPDSNAIVPSIFNTLSDSGYSSLLMGVIGSNKLLQNYQVIFSQIVNQFARISRTNGDVKRLYISIRKSDYSKTLWLSQVYKYVHDCASFYKTKG